jgi:hypothetical protein
MLAYTVEHTHTHAPYKNACKHPHNTYIHRVHTNTHSHPCSRIRVHVHNTYRCKYTHTYIDMIYIYIYVYIYDIYIYITLHEYTHIQTYCILHNRHTCMQTFMTATVTQIRHKHTYTRGYDCVATDHKGSHTHTCTLIYIRHHTIYTRMHEYIYNTHTL